MGFWEDLKDAFKTKSQRDEERAEELEKQYQDYLNSQKKEVNLDELFPPTLGLEKIQFTPETDQSITDRATAEIDFEKAEDVRGVEGKYSSKIGGVEKDMFSATEDKHKKDDELDALFSEKREKQKNASVKNGMARGSVLVSLLEDINQDEMKTAQEVEDAYINTISQLNDEMDRLSAERENALNELDLKYATELKEKIAELKEDRDAVVAKYTKYNNNVDEKEAKYQKDRQEDIAKYLEDQRQEEVKKAEEQRAYEEKYGYSGEKLKNYSERYNLAYDFYMSLSAEIAADALAASPNMKFYLGNYYDKLMEELKNREGYENHTRKYYG